MSDVLQGFDELFLDARLLRAIGHLGFSRPTEIQQQIIPQAMDGLDIVGSAPTGSGKTVAFVLPLLQGLLETHASKDWPRALVLVPTRELAKQIRQVIESLSEFTRIKSTVLTGGVHDSLQQQWLEEQPEIIVATPGRLLDLLDKQLFDLLNVSYLVLDEADRMLDMGFIEEVSSLITQTSPERQTLLFSATMENTAVMDFAELITGADAVRVEVGAARTVPVTITQKCYLTDSSDHKYRIFSHLLEHFRSGPDHKASDPEAGKTLVFVNTRILAEELASRLHAEGIAAGVLHGDLEQKQRNQRLRQFQGGRLSVLIATDVAARGLHVDAIDCVINYDVPRNAEIYLHRAGRTGRNGEAGEVISLVQAFEAKTLQRIERFTRQAIRRVTVAGLEPKNREPEFKRKKKKQTDKKTVKKARVKKRLRARKDKGKPKWAASGKPKPATSAKH